MELSDIADWLADIETSLHRINEKGGCDIFIGDDDSTETEIDIINWGGVDGYLRHLERKSIETNEVEHILKTALVSYVYDIPTINIVSDFFELDCIISVMPKCTKCREFAPAFLDYPAFTICARCEAFH